MGMKVGVDGTQEKELDRETVRVGEPTPLASDPDAKGANAVEAFARDHEGLTADDEKDALDYVLAPKVPRLYGVPVEFDTADGTKKLVFVVAGQDGRKLDTIEQRNVSDTTGKLDVITAECQVVAEACAYLEGRPGHQVRLDSEEFLTVRRPRSGGGEEEHRLASPADALEARFKTQLGLIAGVASKVRQVSGYDPRRVGDAQRRIATAVGNS